MRNIHDETCSLYHTKYCDQLNMKGCDTCAYCGNEEACAEAIHRLDVLAGLLPEGGVSSLFTAEECQLCKQEPRGQRACYALVDMAHIEPRSGKRNVLGMKVKSGVGTLMPVQISCCEACRKRLRTLEYLPVVLPLAVAVVTLFVLSVPAVGDTLRGIAAWLPPVVFAVLAGGAYFIGRSLRGSLANVYAKQMHVDPLELPILRQMREKGWFPLTMERNSTVKPVFLKKRLEQGLGSAAPEDAAAPAASAANGDSAQIESESDEPREM